MSKSSTPRDEPLLDPSVPLDVILCTQELRRRPARPPDYATENRALATLAAALVDSKADIHQVLAETIMSVTHCDSSGLSLLTEDDGGLRFYWPAIAGAWKSQTGRETPRNGGPCGVALDRNSALLFRHFERRYTALRQVVPSAEECLVVPFYVDGVAVGTMWAVMHSDGRRFDAEDERIMTAIGHFAAIAHRTLESLHDLKVQVAAREKAEEALRRMATGAEQQARLIIDSAMDAVVAIDAEGMITEWNKQAENIFGWKRDVAIGRRLSQTVIPERYRAAYEKGLRHFLETGEATVLNRRVEMTALRRNEQEIPVEVSAAPLRMGEPWSFYAFVRDITDRRRAEDALRASEQNLGLIINTIPILAWSARADGFAEFFNQHYLDYSGSSLEAAQGWGWTAAVHPEDMSGLAAYWQSIMPRGVPGEYEARLRRFDGVYRWFLFRAQPLRNTSGQIVKWYGTNTDIEDRKRAEEALRASESSLRDSEQSLRVMFDTIPAMVCTLKADWEVEDANQQLLDYFGKTVDELKQWALIGVVHPDDLEGVIARCRHSTETGEPYDIEHRCRRRDGTFRWFQVSGRPLKNSEGQIVRWYVVLIDIEDWKRAQEELGLPGDT